MPLLAAKGIERPRLRGLYAVTPDEADTARLVADTQAAISGGASLLQYRNKQADRRLRREQAAALQALCLARGVPLIINDDLELALEVGAEGVHLGRDDESWEAARRRLGAGRILGVSCYNEWALAERAVAAGADYLAFGAAFPSRVKPDAVVAPLALYARAKRELPLPVVAIGGIDAAGAAQLAALGVDAVAVISAVFGAREIAVAARAIAQHWQLADSASALL